MYNNISKSKNILSMIILFIIAIPTFVFASVPAGSSDKDISWLKDITNKNKDNVFVFNDWIFSSSPSIKPFDHPVYDIWLIGCY